MQSGFDLNDLVKEAHTRWLKPAEVYFILQNHEDHQLTHEAPQKPTSGSLFLYNKRILRFFRRDGHSWRKKKDGRTVGEAHERLKVGNVEALNCYYAHGDLNPTFQRRSYWMLDPAYEHIVLVHYRDISEGGHASGSFSHLSPVSSLIQSPSSYTTQNPGSISVASRLHESFQNQSSSGSIEVSSELISKEDGIDDSSSSELEVCQALRRIEKKLSLNEDSFKEMGPFFVQDENSNNLEASEYVREMKKECEAIVFGPEYNVHDIDIGHAGIQNGSHNFLLHQDAGDDKDYHRQSFQPEYTVDWNEVLDVAKNSSDIKALETYLSLDGNEKPLSSSTTLPTEDLENSYWLNFDETYAENSSNVLPYDVDNFKFPTYSSEIKYEQETNHNYSTMLFDQSQIGMPLEADSSLTTISGNQKFKIREISPEWGYSSEVTKVIIVGSFLCNPSECAWRCMFGNIEVPIQIIQEGVILCQAPPQLPSKVTLCITSGNRESCSEIREFEYRVKTSSCARCDIPQGEVTKSPEELLLLVRFIQMLLSDPLIQKSESVESGMNNLKTDEDAWGQVIEALLVGSGASSSTMDWLLQELLKDKFQQWISSRSMQRCDWSDCLLSKKEQGIIHMVAGLGFEWALNPIINLGVGVNFRDINGWTALHWAARFGREKVVAALIASGASAGAVTDPNSQDPTGKTPASIAATSRHKGLAGYLSEVALTTHLSSLKLEESELSKDSAELEAEITVNTISNGSHTTSTNEEQLSLKETLAAVRNAAQAAARIQSAFRAHSFRKRQESVRSNGADEYGISSDDAVALSKLTFRNVRDYNAAALSIQKKYRGWKGRKDFLAFRQKVVKIQAHVRGHQMRKNYKVICWAVGILDKVVLRWRRGGVGLRGFRPETEFIDESEDEDIMKVFRRQKVGASIDEAVSRVLSMVESPNARQQYRRMLEKYRQAKAELSRTTSEEATSTSQSDFFDFDKDEDIFYQLP